MHKIVRKKFKSRMGFYTRNIAQQSPPSATLLNIQTQTLLVPVNNCVGILVPGKVTRHVTRHVASYGYHLDRYVRSCVRCYTICPPPPPCEICQSMKLFKNGGTYCGIKSHALFYLPVVPWHPSAPEFLADPASKCERNKI